MRGSTSVGDRIVVRLHHKHRPTAVYNSVCQQPASVPVGVTGGTTTSIMVYANKRIPTSRANEGPPKQVMAPNAEHP